MFQLPDLPYPYEALEPHIDTQTMRIHHDKHHGAYVKNLNDALAGNESLLSLGIEELLQNLHKVPETIRTIVRNNGGGHANHSLFWSIMGPKCGGQPAGKLLELILGQYGSFQTFQEKYTTAGLKRFGSGWVWLVREGDKLVIVDTPNQDSPSMEGKLPILGLDVWEHAYYLKYQNMRGEYIKAWWNVVNWKEVEKRFARQMK